jgi:hypothetical protein
MLLFINRIKEIQKVIFRLLSLSLLSQDQNAMYLRAEGFKDEDKSTCVNMALPFPTVCCEGTAFIPFFSLPSLL